MTQWPSGEPCPIPAVHCATWDGLQAACDPALDKWFWRMDEYYIIRCSWFQYPNPSLQMPLDCCVSGSAPAQRHRTAWRDLTVPHPPKPLTAPSSPRSLFLLHRLARWGLRFDHGSPFLRGHVRKVLSGHSRTGVSRCDSKSGGSHLGTRRTWNSNRGKVEKIPVSHSLKAV